jgi:dynein heavy chain
VSYVGPFNAKFRVQLWKNTWIPDMLARKIPLSAKFAQEKDIADPLSMLADESDFALWKNDGLAADLVSLQNGAILTQCDRWPLMIDPQLQGITWVKRKLEKEQENAMKDVKDGKEVEPVYRILTTHTKNWVALLTRAITAGQTVVLEGVGEDIDATLDPVLSRTTLQKGLERFMRVGSEDVVYNDKFRLILQTKLANPHYKPEIAAQCTIINFIVTEEGLEENLLAIVVNREKAEVEEKKSALARSINNFTVSLLEFENSILQRLNDAPADILGEESLIVSLEETSVKARLIEEKVKEAKLAEITINKNRDEYRMVAAEASWLYFLLESLHNIDHMYQYSLDAFTSTCFGCLLLVLWLCG